MPTIQEWATPDTIATALTTQLNSLANAAQSAASAAIDNEAGLFEWLELELLLASLTPTGSPYCLVYVIYSIDGGTNFEDLSTSALHAGAAAFPYSTATGAKRVNRVVPILPFQFKLAVENRSGPALAASGNTLRYRRFTEHQV